MALILFPTMTTLLLEVCSEFIYIEKLKGTIFFIRINKDST